MRYPCSWRTFVGATVALVVFAAEGRSQGVVTGRVISEGQPVARAQIQVRGTRFGASADSSGQYRLNSVPAGRQTLIARLVGFAPAERVVDVVDGEMMTVDFTLERMASVLNPVVTTGTLVETYVSQSPVKVDVVTARFLERNVTSNLMDNISFVNGLTQQIDCGVCFTNNIRINGMDGPYTAVLIDGAPVMSSLATVYGLNSIHPSLIQQVEVVRGPASTLYGTEAMGGVINIITKDPRFAPRYSLNVFGTSHGETNLDFAVAPTVGNARTLVSGSIAYNDRFVDDNGDNFSDLPLNRRASLFNKWSIGPAERRVFDLSAKAYYEDRFGGTRQWTRADRGSSDVYGESIYTARGEVVGSWRLPLERENVRLWFSGNWHDQDSFYGDQGYAARQGVLFGQLVWDRAIGERHAVLVGGTVRYQTYDDDTPATRRVDRRWIPGVFAQDEWTLSPRVTALAGLRVDHHAEHGVIPSPRLAVKWQPWGNEETTVRLNAATGFRVVNLFTEDHAAYTGARQVIIRETLKPERSRTVTIGINQHLHLGSEDEAIVFDVDGFHTHFTNKIHPDYNADPNLIVYDNLRGFAVTRGVSASAQLSAGGRPYSFMVGATMQEVIVEEDGVRRPHEFAPRVQGVVTAGYAFRGVGLGLDYTARVVGPMQLPEFPDRPSRSKWFSEHHLQATKAFGAGTEIYAAVKNLFDYRQRNPLIDPHDPFGDTFDTSYVYGPIQGRRFVLGARYSVAR